MESLGVQTAAFLQGSEGTFDGSALVGRSGTLGRVPPVSPNPRRGLRIAASEPLQLLTVREVARRLRVSTATVYGLCGRGELPHSRVSNAIRFRSEDLEGFIRRGRR